MRPLLYGHTYWTCIQSARLCVCAYIYIHTCTHIYTYTCACMRPGGAGAGGAKRSPPIAPLSSLYRCGASLPNSSSFPHFQIHHSLLIFHILFYTHTLIFKISERLLVQSTIPIRLHSLQHSPIVQLIRNAACITRTRRASQRDTVGRCKTPGPHRGMTGNIVWS